MYTDALKIYELGTDMPKAIAKTRARVKARRTAHQANTLSGANQGQATITKASSSWEMSANDALKINFVDSETPPLVDS